MSKEASRIIREFLAQIGKRGARAQAAKYPKSVRRKWAKLGGRPPKKRKIN